MVSCRFAILHDGAVLFTVAYIVQIDTRSEAKYVTYYVIVLDLACASDGQSVDDVRRTSAATRIMSYKTEGGLSTRTFSISVIGGNLSVPVGHCFT
jgi:hypothetical protein